MDMQKKQKKHNKIYINIGKNKIKIRKNKIRSKMCNTVYCGFNKY